MLLHYITVHYITLFGVCLFNELLIELKGPPLIYFAYVFYLFFWKYLYSIFAFVPLKTCWCCDWLTCLLLTDDSHAGDNPSKSPLPSNHLPLPTVGSVELECPCSPFLNAALSSSPSPSAAVSTPPADLVVVDSLSDTPSPASSPSSGESEEEKAKKLLYCSLCKVAVNSLSQLEAHNKGKFKYSVQYFILYVINS